MSGNDSVQQQEKQQAREFAPHALPPYYNDGAACGLCGADGHTVAECPWQASATDTDRGELSFAA